MEPRSQSSPLDIHYFILRYTEQAHQKVWACPCRAPHLSVPAGPLSDRLRFVGLDGQVRRVNLGGVRGRAGGPAGGGGGWAAGGSAAALSAAGVAGGSLAARGERAERHVVG